MVLIIEVPSEKALFAALANSLINRKCMTMMANGMKELLMDTELNTFAEILTKAILKMAKNREKAV